jgi:hypothetical protein
MAGDDGLKIAVLLGDTKMETLNRARALVEAVRSVGARVGSIAIGLPTADEVYWRRSASWLLDGLSDVVVRRMSWERVLAQNARRMFAPFNLPISLQGIKRLTLPRDWGTNFLDCDQWLLVAGPEIGGVFPAKPTAIFCGSLVARRVPTAVARSIDAPYWDDQTAAFRMWRQSAVAVANSPLTAADLTSYAGVRPEKIVTLSVPLDSRLPDAPARLKRDRRQLLLRIEPDDAHALNVVLPALQRYLSEGGGLLPVIATEAPTAAFGSKSQIPEIIWLPEAVRHMVERLPIEQLVSHQRWAELLALSGNVWITVGANSDGGSLRQALRSGARVISLDCQLTRLASQQAGGAMVLIPQLTVDDMVETLHRVEADMGNASGLPVLTSDLASLRREIGFVLDRLLEVRL